MKRNNQLILSIAQWCEMYNQPYEETESNFKLNFDCAPLTLRRFKGFCKTNFIDYEYKGGSNYIIKL